MFSLDLVIRPIFKSLEDVSLERALRYYDTTIARMHDADLGGKLTERIAACQAVRTQFFGSATAVDAALTIQMGFTDRLNALVEKMHDELSDRLEGAVRGAFGKNSDGYRAFFPNGLDEYGHATRETTPGLVQRLADAATAHAAELPPATVAALTGYKTAWDALREQQLQGIGTTDDEGDNVKAARAAVYQQLYLTLHYLCYVLEGDEARILHYFDGSILAQRRRPKTDDAPTP